MGLGKKLSDGLDLSTVEGKMQALKAMSSPTVPNEEFRVNSFKMVNVFIHTILLTDEKTGEQQSAAGPCYLTTRVGPQLLYLMGLLPGLKIL